MPASYKDEILRLRKEGKTYPEIESIVGCSRGTVSYHCQNAGLQDIGKSSKELTESKKQKIKQHRKNHTSTETARKFGVSRATVEKYADEKFEKQTLEGTVRNCQFCGKSFTYDWDKGHRKNCCNSCNTKLRRTRNKLKAVKLLGGKCSNCGYSKSAAALDFHHVGEKNVNVSEVANKSWDAIKKELENCELLCANCHREHHSNRYSKHFIEKAVESGRLKEELAGVA